MNRISTAIGCAAMLCGIVGCNKSSPKLPIEIAELVNEFKAVSNENEADVEHVIANAANSQRAIMFIHLEWSFMALYQPKYAEFIVQYQSKYPADNLAFHYVDCTPITHGYKPLRKLPGWQELIDEAGTAMIHGWGEVVWMEKGQVLHVQRITDFDSASELVELTETIMPSGDQ